MTRTRKTLLITGLSAGLLLALGATASAGQRAGGADAFAAPTASELGLAGAKAQRWESLRAESQALRRVGREDLGGGVRELRQLLDEPNPDLRGFTAQSQQKFDAHVAEARALREKQLDFYESLTPAEQAKVRQAMAKRIDRLALLRERIVGAMAAR
jgi:Spy/CpxP family protein refolding chaperone